MRVWDIHVKHLCRKHLLGEHRELHGLWNILTKHGGKGGYSHHPETKRWIGKSKALYNRHEELVAEMTKRDYQHHSPLDKKLATGSADQKDFINTIKEQKVILKEKPCECFVEKHKK
ncbi:MAG: pyrimidine dimer DNA glycosylase [Candidatus Magasanikbacteria bacterium CG_4_10_14_0_2_um_filter_33_14]|uniref:Pyrimidine dimer DNA glycosylase n=1 Tax=Candidatus Magasanikbacteria bacterium CG_4_10_14_0_2_um_filter_33_14 TaxID=1974636 RepID=A0A2M7V890_9BACT|nr:MAG: pyrimidine dimer DNA glycosylase [Candidatus Magasanikbacteria bacterium CG_4_10_14_0_2_um_filter_33_14]